MALPPLKRRSVLLSLLAALVAIVVVAGGIYLLSRDSAVRVSPSDVVSKFRANRGTINGADGSQPTNGPEPGVYRYSTGGSERVDALLDGRHDYDNTSTITVTRDKSRLGERLDLLKERWTRWNFSVSSEGRRLRTMTDFHKFFGVSMREQYRCSGARVPPSAKLTAGFKWTDRCSGDDATVTALGRVIGVEKLTVAGKRVETIHLRSTARLSGRIRGTRIIDFWLLRSNGLIVRRSARSNVRIDGLPTGRARSRERYTIRLRSLKPLS